MTKLAKSLIRIVVVSSLSIILLYILGGYFSHLRKKDQEINTKASEVDEYNLGDETIFIPSIYFHKITDIMSRPSGNIAAYSPGNIPVLLSEKQIKKFNVNDKVIKIEFFDVSTSEEVNLSKGLEATKKVFALNKAAGFQYDLEYFVHSDGRDVYKGLWVDNEDQVDASYILCQQDKKTVTTCDHVFRNNQFSFVLRYDKKLLSDWKNIKTNISNLFDSLTIVMLLKIILLRV